MPLDNAPARGGLAKALLAILGIVMLLIGLVLAIGGVWLVSLKGSPYYLLAGLGLAASGYLIARGRLAGAWIYLAVYAATLVWAVWEVGLAGWPLVPRVIAPTVILILVLAALPALKPGRAGRRLALGGVAVLAALLVVGGFAVTQANRLEPPSPLPAPGGDMGEPSLLRVGGDWPTYGATYSARRYSPLAQITPDNAGRLERVWVAHTRDLPSAAAVGRYGAETTPVKIGDSLYLCTAKNILISLDPATGRARWSTSPPPPASSPRSSCPASRAISMSWTAALASP